MAKSEIGRWPVFGWLAMSVGTLFVPRGGAPLRHVEHADHLDVGAGADAAGAEDAAARVVGEARVGEVERRPRVAVGVAHALDAERGGVGRKEEGAEVGPGDDVGEPSGNRGHRGTIARPGGRCATSSPACPMTGG